MTHGCAVLPQWYPYDDSSPSACSYYYVTYVQLNPQHSRSCCLANPSPTLRPCIEPDITKLAKQNLPLLDN